MLAGVLLRFGPPCETMYNIVHHRSTEMSLLMKIRY